MPSKPRPPARSCDEKDATFDAWWDKRGLSANDSGHPLDPPYKHRHRRYRPHPLYLPHKLGHPLYPPYKKLYREGADLADLDTVDKMACCFMEHNAFVKPNVQLNSISKFASSSTSQAPSLAALLAPVTSAKPKDETQIKIEVGMWAATRALTERPDLFRNETDLERFHEEIAYDLRALRPEKRVLKMDKAACVKEIEQLTRTLRSRGTHEYAIALFQFSLLAQIANSHPRGRRSDLWGTLFLVALTTYLTGAIKKPHYAQANQILKAMRRGNAAKNLNSARSRVTQFKKHYPNWLSVLNGLILYPAIN